MIKIDYNFRTDYILPVINNTIAVSNSLGTINSTQTITNKKFENIDCVVSLDTLSISFINCIFKNCKIIVDVVTDQNAPASNILFENCVIYGCNTIVNTPETFTQGSIIFNYSIVKESPYLITKMPIVFVNLNCIEDFFGHITDLTIATNIMRKNPMFIDYNDFYLMSKNRGYDYNSPCLTKNVNGLVKDIGVWDETRVQGVDLFDSLLIEYIPNETKSYRKIGFLSFDDFDGIARVYFNGSKKYISLDFDKNGLSEEETAKFLDMDKAKDNLIKIYPDHENDLRYIVCRVQKNETLSYTKENNAFWELGKLGQMHFKGFKINASIEEEVGEWI